MEIMKIAQNVSNRRKDIIAGASSASSGMTMEYLEFMSRVGIKTTLVSPPYYYNYSDTARLPRSARAAVERVYAAESCLL